MPRSVTTPVRWVVRTTAPEMRVTRAFCSPIAKQRKPVTPMVPSVQAHCGRAVMIPKVASAAASMKSAAA